METKPLTRPVNASGLSLEQVMSSSKLSEREKVTEASRAFEAVLLRQILAESQKTVIQSGLVKDSASKAVYMDMMNNQLAETLSHGGGLGLGKGLETQLQREVARVRRPANGLQGLPSGTPQTAASALSPAQNRPLFRTKAEAAEAAGRVESAHSAENPTGQPAIRRLYFKAHAHD